MDRLYATIWGACGNMRIMVLDSQPISLYLHFPFCHHKCSYCDLNAYAGLDHLIPAYIAALVNEARLIGQGTVDCVHTLYFGGGTPSITPLPLFADVLAAIRESFMLTDDCEVSLEANPDTVDLAYLEGLHLLGVNRLSIGAQSAQGNELTLFQRTHTFDDVASAVGLAREAGFDNVGLDLIYGVPGQTMMSWQDTLKRHTELDVDHFSVYALSLDFGTPMRAWVNRGLLPEPEGDLAAEMYEWADEELARAGFAQYEISSWAREESPKFQTPNPEFACRHNLQYWRNLPYLGLGAGAHGWYRRHRYSNVASPTAYISRLAENETKPFPFSPALAESTPIDYRTEMNETMLTGLRLTREGVRERDFRERYRVGLRDVFAKELRELRERGLIEWDEKGARLTNGGRLVANWVFEKFV